MVQLRVNTRGLGHLKFVHVLTGVLRCGIIAAVFLKAGYSQQAS